MRKVNFYKTGDGGSPLQEYIEAREEAGLTQDALAKRAKTPKTTIASIEDNAEGASLTVIDRLARALGKMLKVELVEAA